MPVRLVCGRFPDPTGNVALGALALLDAVGVDDLAPEARTMLGNKADRATTLSGYGIADAYTKTEADTAISTAISAVKDSAPEAFDTLKEIADWIGDDQSGAQALINQVANKVDKVAGKGLSTNDYTTAEKEKLGGVEAGAKDNVVEAASASAFPQQGVTGKIYVAKDENKTYRWNGTQYVQVGGGGGSSVTIDDTLSVQGAAADAKATGDALAARPTKAQLDAGWWSEWDVTVPGGQAVVTLAWDDTPQHSGWYPTISGSRIGDNKGDYNNSSALQWTQDDAGFDITATRHRVAAPVPTKPEDIGAQPAGSYATAAQGEKADAALSRAEAEAGFTLWTIFRNGVDVTAQVQQPTTEDPVEAGVFVVTGSILDGDTVDVDYAAASSDVSLDWTANNFQVTYVATRTRLPTMADVPTKTSDLTNDSGFLTQHQQLTPVYGGNGEKFSEWVIEPPIQDADITWIGNGWELTFPPMHTVFIGGDESSVSIEFEYDTYPFTATRTENPVIGYTLGDQTTKPLQPRGDYAPATNIAKTALASAVQTSLGKADTAVQPAALAGAVRYDLPADATVISSASSEVVEGVTVTYGAATLADRTANRVSITAEIAELRLTFPAAVIGKVRDFGLRVEVGDGTAALTAPALVPPAGATLENADGAIPALADGTATAAGVTLLYFSETSPGVFLVKGEQVKEA